MATDVNADLYAEIDGGIERIAVLTAEGNADGAAELANEVEGMISAIKGRSAAVVQRKKDYRAQLTSAQNPELAAKDATAEVAVKMPETIAEVEGLDELVNLGAERVREVTEHNYRGGRAIAEILLDIRRRIILPDGTPDLNARSHAAKQASAEIYDRVTSKLPAEGESEEADGIRDSITSIKRSAQSAMTDVRVEYLRALDNSDPQELELFAAAIKGNGKPSEEIAAHYGIKLMNRAELEAERRKAKELTSGDGDVRKVAASIKRAVKTVESVDPSAVSELSDKEREALKADIKAQLAALTAMLAQLA